MRPPENLNLFWAALIVEELRRNGTGLFCIAPGSRSAPLAVACARNREARRFVHMDERALAFHALGYAAATGNPAAVICTSGSAVANLLPAVVEASKKKLPMVLLTADRPPELRQTGSNQTITQPGIFGEYVRFSVDLPCPDPRIPARFVLTTMDQAVYRARRGNPPGPVHLNCMFREPLHPQKSDAGIGKIGRDIRTWQKTGLPLTRYGTPEKTFRSEEVAAVAREIGKVRRGILAVGKLKTDAQRRNVLRVARKLGWPVFPDITSGLRLAYTGTPVVPHFDQILLSKKWRRALRPDGVLHLGGRMTSKRFYQFMEDSAPAHYITVLNHPYRNDPLHRVTLRLEGDLTAFCTDLAKHLTKPSSIERAKRLGRLSQRVTETIEHAVETCRTPTGASVALDISQVLAPDTGLFLASSLPVRDMDMFAAAGHGRVAVESNRGASGIDGTVATACGFAAGLGKPVTLLIGDLALLHDLNALHMVRALKVPMIIVVVNNDGGGIFSFLPIAGSGEVFEPYFATPHGLTDFHQAAALFGIDYIRPSTRRGFREAYAQAVKKNASVLIEVRVNREANYHFQTGLEKAIEQKLRLFK